MSFDEYETINNYHTFGENFVLKKSQFSAYNIIVHIGVRSVHCGWNGIR